jgi:hypothetical protein
MSEERKEEQAEDLNAGGQAGASPPDVRRAADEDLPPELKAIEAELASLTPRTDRLDRERLIFLAGQQSVCAEMKGTVPFSPTIAARRCPENRDSPRVRWVWPAAFAAMTAVAATLLVMLLLQPEPQVKVRMVKVPAGHPGNDDVVPGTGHKASPSDRKQVEPLPREPSLQPPQRSSLLASVGWDWLHLFDRGPSGSETSYSRLLGQVLREGSEDWPLPRPVADAERASVPVLHRELRDRLLGTPASKQPVPDWPLIQTLFSPGANS